MKMRLYDAGKKCENYPDRYTLYFHYPKWLEKECGGTCGCFLGCSPTTEGMYRCSWDYNEGHVVNGCRLWLGKKIKLESMPEPFQECARRLEECWNDALKFNDDKHWEIWNHA